MDVRGAFLKLIDRPRVPLAPQLRLLESTQRLDEFHFTFAADSCNRVPGILVKSRRVGRAVPGETHRFPVVIVLHGTGGTKTDNLPLLCDLCFRGFIAVAIDTPYHGERTQAGSGADEYNDAIFRAWQSGGEGSGEHPFFFDTVWDVMRLIDYLVTRDDVDPQHIGLYGISKGGIETYLAAAVDTRIAAAVPCLGVQSFGWALDNDQWQSRIETIQGAFDTAARAENISSPDAAFVRGFYDRVAPGIYDSFDGPVMTALIAPRPLFIINGQLDPRTPLPGVQLCIDAAKAAYRAAGADDKLTVLIQPDTAHEVTPQTEQQALDWLQKWLRE